jgi:type II secretory pathway pseudopilin PulG
VVVRRPTERGAILLVVLAVLAMMAILAASLSRSARSRVLAAQEFQRAEMEARHGRVLHGGEVGDDHATIDDGAAGASSNEAIHGSQTIPPGGDDRLRRGTGRQGHR